MISILLCCASGMSSSLLVQKMKIAASKQGIEAKIKVVSVEDIQSNSKDVDVILLGPQVHYIKKDIETSLSKIPVADIGIREYGMLDGKSVLKQAMEFSEKFY